MASRRSTKSLQCEKERHVRKGNWWQAAEACVELADKFADSPERALKEFEDRKTYCEYLGNHLEVAKSYRQMGELCIDLRRYENALKYAKKYLSFVEKAKDQLEIQRALETMGTVYFEYGRNDKADSASTEQLFAMAEHFFERSHEQIDAIPDSGCPAKEKAEMKCKNFYNRFQAAKLANRKNASNFLQCLAKIAENSNLRTWHGKAILEKMNLALEEKKIDLAQELCQKALQSKNLQPTDEFAAIMAQADIHLHKRNFREALETLRRAKRTKRDQLEEKYFKWKYTGIRKVVKTVSALENCDDSMEKGRLCERLGDQTSKLKTNMVAVGYYKDALQNEKWCRSKKSKRAELLFSIAQCYYDEKEFKTALEYYLEEKKLSPTVATSIKIIKCLTSLKMPYSDIEKEANVSLEFARATEQAADELTVLKALRNAQDAYHMSEEEEITRAEIVKLSEKIGDYEVDDEDDPAENSDFSTDSSESEEDSVEDERKRRTKVKLKPDILGETALHKLCKKEGNGKEIRKLIAGVATVDLIDNSNFTPLHEACNYGILEYVEMLCDAGADINRVAGALPDRITPLISACGNGHLDVIKYLIDRGAKVNAQDNCGWSAIDHLVHAIKTKLSEDDEKPATELLQIMKDKIKKMKESGQNVFLVPKQKESKALLTVGDDDEESFEAGELQPSSLVENVPKRAKHILRNALSESRRVPQGAETYVEAIASLRPQGSRRSSSVLPVETKKQKNYHLSGNEYDVMMTDDLWLEDDLEKRPKKRKVDPFNAAGGSRRRSEQRRSSEKGSDEADAVIVLSQDKDVELTPPSRHFEQAAVEKPELNLENIKKVKISMAGRLFLIPFDPSKTVGDLCAEASRRYESMTGMRPASLQLSTREGAELHQDDPVAAVVGDNDELEGKIVNWDHLPPLHERYLNACVALKTTKYREVEVLLMEAQSSRRVAISSSLGPKCMEPVFRALKGQVEEVDELVLSRNKLGSLGLKLLCDSLPSLTSLRKLDLSCNGITGTALKQLEEKFTSMSAPALPNLSDLNLGFNPLGDHAFDSLLSMLQGRSLRIVALQSCFFTSGLVKKFESRCGTVLRSMTFLEEFNFSYNEFSAEDKDVVKKNVAQNCRCLFYSEA